MSTDRKDFIAAYILMLGFLVITWLCFAAF